MGLGLIKERFWGTILRTMNLGFMSMGVQMKSFFERIFEDAKVAWNLALDHPLGIGPLEKL
jgi:hypothetical protein